MNVADDLRCLQEITYLTSPGALNPLPLRLPIDSSSPLPSESAQEQAFDSAAVKASNSAGGSLERPRKSLPEHSLPSMFVKPEISAESLVNGMEELVNHSSSTSNTTPFISPSPPRVSAREASPEASSQSMHIDPTARPPSSPAIRTMNLPDETDAQILTAIYRPESKAAWREELRTANEKAEKVRASLARSSLTMQAREVRVQSDEEQLANLTLDDEEKPPDQIWTCHRSLKSHLDVVRAVAFAHGPGIIMATGGDDNTVKVWSIDMTKWVTRVLGLELTVSERLSLTRF